MKKYESAKNKRIKTLSDLHTRTLKGFIHTCHQNNKVNIKRKLVRDLSYNERISDRYIKQYNEFRENINYIPLSILVTTKEEIKLLQSYGEEDFVNTLEDIPIHYSDSDVDTDEW